MAYPETGLTKFRYASIIAASLAWLIATQGDAVGLMSQANGKLFYLPARGGRPHLRSLIARIDRLEPGAEWQPDRVLARASDRLHRRGLVVAISDFYDAEDETRRELRRVARRGHDVAMMQVVSPEEMQFPFRGDIEFQDLESGERRIVDAASTRVNYSAALQAFLERCRRHAQRDGIDYALFTTDLAPERALRSYLLRRTAPS
jgi:uncharacterized protein (DUF58 family)